MLLPKETESTRLQVYNALSVAKTLIKNDRLSYTKRLLLQKKNLIQKDDTSQTKQEQVII